MATIAVSVKSDSRGLQNLVRQGPAAAAQVAAEATDLREDIQRRMPKRTGQTARDTHEVQRGPYDWAVEIPEVPGRFLVEGTRPHVIEPVRARALRFVAGGSTVFARVVNHPGTRPNAFAEDAARAALPTFASRIARLFGGH